jgi:mycofactocin system glycosyltransferase
VRVTLDPRIRWTGDGRVLTPTGRLLRLSSSGRDALRRLGSDEPAAQRLAARLVDAGAAHPHPAPRAADDVTVVIPVKDRAAALDRCLSALGQTDVLVIDDGSTDPVAVSEVCARHGARLVHRPNGGPAAARNTAIPLLRKAFVLFLDSDCLPPPALLERLRGHLDDPAVVAVAPRVVGGPRSPLDLGPHPAKVRPGGAVGYVPTAALLVRRSALTRFDEDLRYGEDVDLVWRLVASGGVVRYDPTVVVEHSEPTHLTDRLVRRYHYGTSAAPLSQRHPDHLTHLVLPPWPTTVLALLLTRHPVLAAAAAATATARLDRQVHDVRTSARLVGQATAGTALGVGRALQLAGPVAWWAARRRPVVAGLIIAPLLHEWWQRRPAEDPVSYSARGLLDQAAYGAGVAAGCVGQRTVGPLVPRRGPQK